MLCFCSNGFSDKLQNCRIHKHQTLYCYYLFSSLAQEISTLDSEVQHTKITVSWSWRTLVKVMVVPCTAKYLLKLVVGSKETAGASSPIKLDVVCLPQEAGSSPMELEFPHQNYSGNSTVRTHSVIISFVCTAEEVEWLESTGVKYFVEQILPNPYTFEYTQQTLVSVHVARLSW